MSALLDSGRATVRRLGYGGILALMLAVMTRPVSAADQILLLDVQLNGHSINKIGEFTLRDGELMARCSELRELGLRGPSATKSRGGIPSPDSESDCLAALTDLRGLTWHLDQKTQTLYLTAADALLLPTLLQVDQRSISHRRIESGTGMTLNYDIVNTFASSRNSTSGVLDLRAFSPLGVASSGLLVYAGGGASRSTRKATIRLDSVYTFGDAVALRRYSIGDFITDSLVWTRPVRLTGAQIRSDFSMRPDLITFPLPSIRGSTAVPSTVDVLANGNYISSQQVDPGPFQIPQLPVMSGAGTISLRVTNALGQQVMVTQPFYASSALLKPGLQTYSAEAGAVRRNWGAVSNDYGKFAGTATYRRGLTPTLTVEGSAEGTPGMVKAGAGGVVQVGNWGVLNFAAAGSTGSGLPPGAQYSLSAQRISRKFSLGGSATVADRNFRDVAAMNGDPVPRRELSANFGLALGLFGSIGVAYAGLDRDAASSPIQINILPAQHSRVFSASYSVQVHHMSIYATEFQDFASGGGGGLQFGVTIPFGRRSSVSVSGGTGGGYGQVQAQQSAVSFGDWGYQAYISADPRGHEFIQALYKARRALLSAGVDVNNGQTTVNLESQGALSLIGGDLYASNAVSDSFAVVDSGGLGHVRVLQENRNVGSTNSKGRLLVPDLRAFDINRLAIDPTDISQDATADVTAREVRPQNRSGVLVKFRVKMSHGALLRLVDEAGMVVPMGSTATLLATSVTVPVGYDGEAYIQDLNFHNEVAVQGLDGRRCTVLFEYRPILGEIPTIGPLSCREQKR